jgi:O-succinylbenzoic acid--CoA ligase
MAVCFDLHPKFRLNGISYDLESLLIYADTLCHSSDPTQKDLGIFLTQWLSDSTSIQLQTSGSTGEPKQITADKSKLIASAKATIKFLHLQPQQTALLCLPLQYIGGKMMLIRAMVGGLWIDVASPTATPFAGSKPYDFSAVTPYQLQHALSDLHHIGQLLVGGAAVSTKLANAVKGVGAQVYETYGMTETFSHVALKNLSLGATDFHALSGVSFTVEDECLVVHAPHLMDKPIMTNDVVKLISNSSFVWLGRADHVINSGGIKLYPEQIEKQLSQLFNVPLMVFGMPDEALGQSLSVVFEGALPENAEEIIKNSKLLSRYEKPKHLCVLSQFVRRNDKLMRHKTLEQLRTQSL